MGPQSCNNNYFYTDASGSWPLLQCVNHHPTIPGPLIVLLNLVHLQIWLTHLRGVMWCSWQ
jgi:hypothetical protein